jgi:hypothetical protein
MKTTANTIIPAILLGGTALGLLAATEINTRMKAGPEPEWRVAAREAAMNAVTYSFVDSGPSDLSPSLPWVGTWRDDTTVMFPEDLHRTRDLRIYEPEPYSVPDLSAAEALDVPRAADLEARAAAAAAKASLALERPATRVTEVAAALPSDGREAYVRDMAKPVDGSVVQSPIQAIPLPEPAFPSYTAADAAEDRLGG